VESLTKFNSALKEIELLLFETRSALQKSEEARTSISKSDQLNRANTFSRSALVLLCGHFEGYLKEILKEFATIVNQANVKVDYTPTLLLETALSTILERCPSGGEKYRQKLQSTICGQTALRLEPKSISNTGGNPKVEIIEQMLLKIGIPDVLEQLSQEDFGYTTYSKKSQVDNSMRRSIHACISERTDISGNTQDLTSDIIELIEGKWQARSQRREVGYVAVIQDLLKKRNIIAHGEAILKITDKELEDYIKNIRKLAVGLEKVIEKQIFVICGEAISYPDEDITGTI